MANHISAELPLLLSGEASRPAVDDAAAHLRVCEDCRQDLVSVVIAHASLASAHRYAADVMGSAGPARAGEGAGRARPLPDLSGVLEVIRAEADSDAPVGRAAPVAALCRRGGRGRRHHRRRRGGDSPAPHRIRHQRPDGAAQRLRGRVDARVGHHDYRRRPGHGPGGRGVLASLAPTQRYEMWLTNTQRTRMQPVGWIGTDGRATVNVPQQVMNQFTDIEVSVQRVDAPTYDYSGTSVLRGQYAS